MVLHACLHDDPLVVVSNDKDVLLLLIHAYATIRPNKDCFMKFDHAKYVNICKVVNHLGSEVSARLTQIHAITGCDTTSFLHNVGKVKVL